MLSLSQRTDLIVLERSRGIEPLTLAWKAKVIPFYELRVLIITYTNTISQCCQLNLLILVQ
jgi:hypothetical protein